MRVVVDTIPERGLVVPLSIGLDWARDGLRVGLGAKPRKLAGEMVLKTIGDHVLVSGSIEATGQCSCARCTAKVELTVEGEISLSYTPSGAQVLEDERELLPSELDAGWYSEGALELEHVLSEQLALWTPDRVRCTDEGVVRLDEGNCALPGQDGGPDLKTHRPFANLRLPE